MKSDADRHADQATPRIVSARPLTLVVGSTNPAKLRAVARAAEVHFPASAVTAVDTASGVSEQPRSDAEALRGAEQRARAAMAAQPSDLAIGIESGVAEVHDSLYGFTWVAVLNRDGDFGRACSARIQIPSAAAEHITVGATLEAAMLRLGAGSGLGREGGAMGHLTGGAVTRTDATLQALHFALARFAIPDRWAPRR